MANPLFFGWSGMPVGDFGQGPGGDTGLPIWRSTQIVPTTSNIQQIIDACDLYDMQVVCNFAGNRPSWTNPDSSGHLIFDWSKYEANVRRFQGNANVVDAVARHRLFPFTCDEPHIIDFNGTVTTAIQNDMGLLLKQVFGPCLTCQRSAAGTLNDPDINGFPFLPPDYISQVTGQHEVGYTGLDYGSVQWNKAAVNTGKTPRQYWIDEKAKLAALNLGMVPMVNWVNGGDGRLWDYKNTGTSSGRIAGTITNNWLMSPQELKDKADAIFDDDQAPVLHGFNYCNPTTPTSAYQIYQVRSDFVGSFDYMLNKFLSRTTFSYRIAKGSTTPPPPTNTTFRNAGNDLGTRRGVRKMN